MDKNLIDKKKHNSLLNFPHLLGYVFIGSIAACSGWVFLIFMVLVFDCNKTAAYFISGHMGILISFYLNYKYNFMLNDAPYVRLMKKYMINITGLLIGYIFLTFLNKLFFDSFIFSSFISYFIIFFYQYILNKIFTYKLN